MTDIPNDSTAITTTKTKTKPKPYVPTPPCHDGNVEILKVGKGILYAGGWSRGAAYPDIAIDLTGTSEPRRMEVEVFGPNIFRPFLKVIRPDTSWLKLPVKDYGVPDYKLYEWQVLADILYTKMDKYGKEVLIACQGGHGRTGMVVSIMGYLLGGDEWKENPIKYLRSIYCEKAVETAGQERYVYKTLGLDIEVDKSQYESKWKGSGSTYWQNSTKTWKSCSKCGLWKAHEGNNNVCTDCQVDEDKDKNTCPICGETSHLYAEKYGMCLNCVDKAKKLIQKAVTEGKEYNEYLLVDNICIMCGEENCWGVKVGRCGHVVHDQPATHDTSLCDDCYKTQHWEALG